MGTGGKLILYGLPVPSEYTPLNEVGVDIRHKIIRCFYIPGIRSVLGDVSEMSNFSQGKAVVPRS